MKKSGRIIKATASCCLFFSCVISLQANPKGCHVISGSAVKKMASKNVLELETSDKAILHWDDFSINAGEITRFIQPNAASTVLNRVVGNLQSSIKGQLESNGSVFLVNPNGVIIGKEGRINVTGFLASTLEIHDTQFLQDAKLMFSGSSEAGVINLGCIHAKGGDIFLIGHQVENSGFLDAPQGTVGMAAAQSVIIKPSGSKRIYIRPSDSSSSRKDHIGVKHTGHIEAIQAELQADGNPYIYAIRNAGTIDAMGVRSENGRIYLIAEGGNVDIQSALLADHEMGTGGEIQITADKATLKNGTSLSVSTPHGGGSITINAERLFIDESATLQANSTDRGDGGLIHLTGKKDLQIKGTTEAKGAGFGKGGHIVLDSDLSISPQGTIVTKSPTTQGVLEVRMPMIRILESQQVSRGNTLTTATIDTLLRGNHLTLTAKDGSIFVDANILWNTPSTLTLKADSTIFLTGGIYSTYAGFASGTNSIILKAPDLKMNLATNTEKNNIFLEAISGNLVIDTPTDISYYTSKNDFGPTLPQDEIYSFDTGNQQQDDFLTAEFENNFIDGETNYHSYPHEEFTGVHLDPLFIDPNLDSLATISMEPVITDQAIAAMTELPKKEIITTIIDPLELPKEALATTSLTSALPFDRTVPPIATSPTLTIWRAPSPLLSSSLFFDSEPYGNHLNNRQHFKIGFHATLPRLLSSAQDAPLRDRTHEEGEL